MDVEATKQLLFSHRGRLRRRTFWAVAVAAIAALGAVALVGFVLATVLGALAGGDAAEPAMIAFGVVVLAMLPLVLAMVIAIGVKRLHDRDKSGWWLVVFYGVPAALRQSVPFLPQIPALVAYVTFVAVGLWAVIELGVLRGTVGPNRHGEDPIADDPPWTIDPTEETSAVSR